jgi:hypothetical protein
MKIKLTKTQYENLLNEMRFDGKSTGLFADEEPKEVNEFFGEKVKKFVGDKKEKMINSFNKVIDIAQQEYSETKDALKIVKKMLLGKDVTPEEVREVKVQSADILKLITMAGLGVISVPLTILIVKVLKKYGINLNPSSVQPKEDPKTGEDLTEGRKKKVGRPKAERSKSGRSVPGKYLTKNKSAMKKEIDKYAGKDTYKTKWDADYTSGKGGVGKRYKTKKSAATKAYERMYGSKNESVDLEEAKKGKSSTDDTLAKKAKASGISKTILKQVHSRGMAAWNSGHRPGTPQNAWAMGRVNSFITGSGGARKADADLWKKAKKSKDRKKKSKKNESININRMVITENRTIISEGLKYHLDNQIPLVENVYRYGSESYFNLINEVRELYNKGKVDLSFMDEELIKTDIGKKAIFEGKEVWLDIPMEDSEILTEAKFRGKTVKTSSPQRSSSGGKAYRVYVSGCSTKTKSNPSGVKQIRFGSGGLRAKLSDPDRRKAFDSRHGCSKGRHNDKCKAGYWSCRLPRYAKKLGLSGGGTWW